MSASKGAESLIRHRREQSQRKQRDVFEAIRNLLSGDRPITVSSVGREAKVSREFIHSHGHLHEAVAEAARSMEKQRTSSRTIQTSTSIGLRSDRATLAGRVEKQKTQIVELENQLRRLSQQQQLWWGSQLADTERVDPEAHTELRVANERMVANNKVLTKQLAEARRLISVLEDSLAASRQAHAEDLQNKQLRNSTLVPIDRAKRQI